MEGRKTLLLVSFLCGSALLCVGFNGIGVILPKIIYYIMIVVGAFVSFAALMPLLSKLVVYVFLKSLKNLNKATEEKDKRVRKGLGD